MVKLNLGCGYHYLKGYVNIDKYNTLKNADLVIDACNLNGFEDNSVDEIHTSHMIEHLTYDEFVNALQEWKRVLKSNGKLIIRCPNIEQRLEKWLEADYEERWGKDNAGIGFIFGAFREGEGQIHKNMFTVKRLGDLVREAGFYVTFCKTYVSRDKKVEDADIMLEALK